MTSTRLIVVCIVISTLLISCSVSACDNTSCFDNTPNTKLVNIHIVDQSFYELKNTSVSVSEYIPYTGFEAIVRVMLGESTGYYLQENTDFGTTDSTGDVVMSLDEGKIYGVCVDGSFQPTKIYVGKYSDYTVVVDMDAGDVSK